MTKPVHVAHFINHLGYGGTERQLFLLLSSLDRAAFRHSVMVFNPSPECVYDQALAALGVEVCALPADCHGVPRRLLFLRRWLRARRVRVVHSWTVHDNPYAGIAGRLAGVPVRWGSLRGSLYSASLQRQPAMLRSAMLRSVQHLVVNSKALLDELTTAGHSPRRLLLLPNCVKEHTADVPADLAALGVPDDARLVGLVGNLRPVKNHHLFVRAMARVLPSRPGVQALLVGQSIPSEPGYRADVEAEILRLGLGERVRLAGFRDDVPAVLDRLAVLCLTSHSEGLPNAVLEAMMAARPVVACRVGGVPELIDDGIHGLLVDPGDLDGLAAAVGKLLDDPELAAAMGRAGRARATAEFSCRTAASRLGQSYLQALGESGEFDA